MSDDTTPATGEHTTNGRPHGFTTLTPFIVVDRASEAIGFYAAIFAARLVSRLDGPDGAVAHAELEFGEGRLQLSDPNEAFGLVAPDRDAIGVTQSLVVYVPDVDATVARAIELGAVVVEPVATFVSGDRYGAIRDPFGRRWSVMTRVEDLSPEESDRRVKEWFASLAS